MVQIKREAWANIFFISQDWNYSADCRNANILMIAAAARMREGVGTENYFTVRDEIVELRSVGREQHNIWGQWALVSPGYLPPLAQAWTRAPSHPFTFLAAADIIMVLCTGRSVSGHRHRPVPGLRSSPGLGHTDTNTRVLGHGAQRSLQTLREILLELYWSSNTSSAQFKINFSPSIKRKKYIL